jgi:hypothetical protein
VSGFERRRLTLLDRGRADQKEREVRLQDGEVRTLSGHYQVGDDGQAMLRLGATRLRYPGRELTYLRRR